MAAHNPPTPAPTMTTCRVGVRTHLSKTVSSVRSDATRQAGAPNRQGRRSCGLGLSLAAEALGGRGGGAWEELQAYGVVPRQHDGDAVGRRPLRGQEHVLVAGWVPRHEGDLSDRVDTNPNSSRLPAGSLIQKTM